DDARRRLGRLCAEYEPKFRGLVAPKQQGEDVGKEQAMAIHRRIAELRLEFLAAVESGLTPEQRVRLAAVPREGPGLPAFVAEDAALVFVLLTAGLPHFAQPGALDALAEKLDLTAGQKKQFQAVAADYGPKIDRAGKQLLELRQEERAAMEKVLTEEQRAKWREMRKAGGEEK